jgi:asparagine synthase (glutamine-hydrolysing)
MCGIAGYFGSPDPLAAERVKRMLRAQRHRGPDGAGMFVKAPHREPVVEITRTVEALTPPDLPATVVLGHNWLAIQDPAPAAAQPMSIDGVTLTFNGEIYNFVELADELRKSGVELRTHSDTEVLLHLWRARNTDCLDQLRGMFAFGAYDAQADTLTLVRDPFGIKPLYLARTEKGAYFASEIRAFRAGEVVAGFLRDGAVLACVSAGINKFHPMLTLYDGVDELPPGHLLHMTRDGTTTRAYYALPPLASSKRQGASGELASALSESVDIHLRSARRIATCLSGGLDSTNLAILIGRAARQTHHDYETFTIRTSGPQDSELASAAEVARAAGLRHTVLDVERDIAPRDVLEMVVACESPNHVIGPVNQFLLLREIARSGATVVLDGQGGDELVSGYPWYAPVLVRAIERAGGDVATLKRQLAERLPFDLATAAQFDAMFHDARAWVSAFMWQGTFLGHSVDEIVALPETQYYLHGGGGWGPFRQRMYVQGELQYLLRQEDRLGMWFGLECRVPFVDRALVDLASTFDPAWLIKDGFLKYPYRVMLPELPERVRWNTRKRGFWETDRDRFPWVKTAGKKLALESPTLRRVFKSIEAGWDALSFDQHWRLLQVAVLERCATREDVGSIGGDFQ